LKDPKPTVKAKAISLLPSFNKPEYKALFLKAVNDSSYSVAGKRWMHFLLLTVLLL
jgi:hypothetical protein